MRAGRGVLALLALACAPVAQAQDAAPPVRLVDSIELDPARFDEAFGGISGIDYDARRRRWLLLSDDRSEHAPARLYTVEIGRSAKGWRVGKARRLPLRDARGQPFPRPGLGREAVDPEAIRVSPSGRAVFWSSEGDAKGGHGPAVFRANRRGRAQERLALPANLRRDSAGRRGPRDNASFEGLDFSPDGALWIAMEAPLIEDGLSAAEGRAPLVRFTRLREGEPTRQFAYRVDAPPQGADNGVTEILAIDDARMLVLERSGAPIGDGSYRFRCRLYLADFAAASDVAGSGSLATAAVTPAAKRLMVDFDTLPDNPGNLEAMAWWPSPGGRRDRIVVVNDDNFFAGEPTRLLLLALSPEVTGRPTH